MNRKHGNKKNWPSISTKIPPEIDALIENHIKVNETTKSVFALDAIIFYMWAGPECFDKCYQSVEQDIDQGLRLNHLAHVVLKRTKHAIEGLKEDRTSLSFLYSSNEHNEELKEFYDKRFKLIKEFDEE